jgi:hypothetical protein
MPNVVVSIRNEDFDRADVVLVGFVDGTWPTFERSIAAGLACQAAGNGLATADDVRRAAITFRRAHHLLAGDELDDWLTTHSLSRDDWRGYLHRHCLRQRFAGQLAEILADYPVSPYQVVELLPVEMACDGILQRCATTLVEWAAPISDGGGTSRDMVAALAAEVSASAAGTVLDVGIDDLHRRLGRLLALRGGYERFVEQVSGDDAIARCLAGRRLDWLQLRCLELSVASDDAAHEVLMCLREDGLEPEEVARLAGAELLERTVAIEEVAPPLAAQLVSAVPGEVLGPLPGDDGASRVLIVNARLFPSPEDPVMRQRAQAELVAAALEPLLAGTVRWHESF